MKEQYLDNLARLAIESGVSVKPGEEVMVRTTVHAAPLARRVAKYAYERGAKRVYVEYRDDALEALDFEYQSTDTLTHKPQFIYDGVNYFAENGGCYIAIISENPDALKHADPAKLTASRTADMKGKKTYYQYAMSNKVKWTIIAYPEREWAKKVFPDLGEDEAYEKLGEYIAKTTRADCADPVAEWKRHAQKLHSRCEKLNAAKIRSFRYKNSLGTDVTVGMPEGYVFAGGSEECNGEPFNANMPSEEVFSAPDCRNINGTVKASMPLSYSGKIIDGISLKLKDGKIVEYDAKTNRDVLKGIIETDEGAKSFGEIALVPFDSPISNLGTLFYETLFDENASCHFAIGKAYPTCVKGGDAMTEAQMKEVGLNESDVHVDFMVGTRDLQITAETADGKTIKVFENGNFTKDFD